MDPTLPRHIGLDGETGKALRGHAAALGVALADAGAIGARGIATFARSADWRTEADRILAIGRHEH